MAYNTREIVTDKNGNPISQYYNAEEDRYEPVEGMHGGNKVVVEDNDLSLTPILDKLSELAGTVIDEEDRKNNEKSRIENEDLRTHNENARLVFENYNSDKSYLTGNKVYYQGSSYVNTRNSKGIPPTNKEYWLPIAVKGEKGDRGNDGVVNNIDGHFALQIEEDGNLYLIYPDEGIPPDMYIDDSGNLIWNLGEW